MAEPKRSGNGPFNCLAVMARREPDDVSRWLNGSSVEDALAIQKPAVTVVAPVIGKRGRSTPGGFSFSLRVRSADPATHE